MRVAIVGFAGSGKTTIFNALTGLRARTGPHREEGKPHLGVIKVPDKRLETLGAMLGLRKITHVEITFMDFPPAKGEKPLDENRINQIKEGDALAQVVKSFADPLSESLPSPLKEIQGFASELKLADLGTIENRLARLKKEKGRERERDLLERCRAFIESDQALRLFALTEAEEKALSGFGFLSQKPLLVVVNIGEEEIAKPLADTLLEYLAKERLEAIPLSGRVEMELAELKEEERSEFLIELGLMEPARDRFVRSCYALMDLVSFFTHNEQEVRAWTIKRATPALKAAGKVHTDMERGFIRAEVIHYDDFIPCGSEAKCREAGKLRLEGKEYIVQDGDIIRFRFHV